MRTPNPFLDDLLGMLMSRQEPSVPRGVQRRVEKVKRRTSARVKKAERAAGRAARRAGITGASVQRYLERLGNPKLLAFSKDRYRASATERRLHGGKTVTEFYVMRPEHERDASKWVVVKGYGPTPGQRKTDAIQKGEILLRQRGIL